MSRTLRHSSRRRRALALFTGLILLLPAAGVAEASPRAASSAGGMRPAVASGAPLRRHVVAHDQIFSCQSNVLDSGAPRCYIPSQIQAAYGFSSLYAQGLNGKGSTIVIIDAFQNPYMATDLQFFDDLFGLPDPVFKQVAPQGLTPFDITDENQVGWSSEIALDVEWAHAIAPKAHITLVLAKSNDDADILAATKYAVDHNLGDVISQSFGEAESCVAPDIAAKQHDVFVKATLKGISLFASSGDDGAAQPTCDESSFVKSASSPAIDPYVTAVGGTNLVADADTGAYGGERAWADLFSGSGNIGCFPTSAAGCSGGGFSDEFGRPFYQFGFSGTQPRHRGVPDVAYNAGVDGGVIVHWGAGDEFFGGDPKDPNSFWLFGGTSAGSPQWAALAAIADQKAGHRLGLLNDDLYLIASSSYLYPKAFHDIKSGNNTFDSVTGYQTKTKWDAVTGLGSPNAAVLVPLLAGHH